MNRRQFLHTVGGAAVMGSLQAAAADGATGQSTASAPEARRRVAVFWHAGFPTVDTEPVSEAVLRDGLADFDVAWLGVDALADQLAGERFDVLVTPYGSAFPRSAWPCVRAFLGEGGNWVNLGGVPSAVPVAKDGTGWRAEHRQSSLHDVLGISQAFAIDIPAGAAWKTSDQHPWSAALEGHVRATRAFSFYTRLTEAKFFPDEDGSDGPRGASIEPLLTAMRPAEGSGSESGSWPVAAPVIMMDRLAGEFAGGRWVFVTGNGSIDASAIRLLVTAAAGGSRRLTAAPTFACFRPSEVPALSLSLVRPRAGAAADVDAAVTFDVFDGGGARVTTAQGRLAGRATQLRREDALRRLAPGFYRVEARVPPGPGEPLETRARTGFWVHDPAILERVPPIAAGTHTLSRGGAPFVATGTTYMAGDVSRQFLLEPNPAVWQHDFGEMRRAGVNVVRTGIWTGWSRYMPEPGRLNEAALRALDAFMLTASAHDIAVAFTFFAFVPPTWGGTNPYLDPRAIEAQAFFVTAIASRYRAMKGVMWDLINEPSFCSPERLWVTRPNYDAHETRAWREWLASRYPSAGEADLDARLQEYWRTLPGEALSLPALADFEDANIFAARRPLKVLEYRLFAQAMFRRWAGDLTAALRSAAPASQLITVGQDEGGTGERPSNHFFGTAVDVTCIHTWWNNDDLLWDTIVSKHPARANLAQETGVMFYETADGLAWRTEAQVRDVFERKLALAVGVSGAGFINWIWNTNPYMPSDNEAAIGLLRPDGTAKPEFHTWRAVARFAQAAAPFLVERSREDVVMVIPHANQFSVRAHAIAATRQAVRAMHYHCRTPMAAVSEFDPGAWPVRPSLVVVPSPRILTRQAWAALRAWVDQGTTLLVTGPFDDDEHWIPTGRMTDLGFPAGTRPVMPEEQLLVEGVRHTVRYRGEKMHRVEAAAIGAGAADSTAREVRVGAGRVLWSPLPVELAEEVEPTAALYLAALKAAGLGPEIRTSAGSGVLVHPARYRDAVLYTLVSETPTDGVVAFEDAVLGRSWTVVLRAGGASLLLARRSDGQVLADYPRGCARQMRSDPIRFPAGTDRV